MRSFYEDLSIIIKYPQIRTLSLLVSHYLYVRQKCRSSFWGRCKSDEKAIILRRSAISLANSV